MCDGPCKTANDESLARDEGGGRTPLLRDATYKTVQGCLLRTTPATATIIFLRAITSRPGSTTSTSEGGVGMCDPGAGDYHWHEDSLSGDIIGAEGG